MLSHVALCGPVDCSSPGSSVRGILQARILEWVAFSFSRGSCQPRDRTQVSHIAGRRFNLCTTREARTGLPLNQLCHFQAVWLQASHLSCVRLCVMLWTVAHQAPLSVGFSRQEYWSGLPFPPPGDLLDPGIEPKFPASPELAGRFFTTVPPGKT